jgi:hypothetical protein
MRQKVFGVRVDDLLMLDQIWFPALGRSKQLELVEKFVYLIVGYPLQVKLN